jgi:transglutaminase-like putative cysteine protease
MTLKPDAILQLGVLAALAGLAFAPAYATGSALLVVVVAAVLAVGLRAASETFLPGRDGLALAISAGAYLLFVANTVLRDTVLLVIPTPATIAELLDGAVNGWARAFSTEIPVADDPTILLIPPTLTWIAGFVASGLALRRRAALAPVVPALVLYVVALVFTGGQHWSSLVGTLFLASLLGFVLLRGDQRKVSLANVKVRSQHAAGGRLVVDLEDAEQAPEATEARRRRLVIGGVVALAVVVLVPLVGPRLPFSDAREPLDPRELVEEDEQEREDLNPLVLMREQLNLDDPRDVFTVRAEVNGAEDDARPLPNWRVAVLDQFDGVLWSSSSRYDPVGSEVPADPTLAVPTQTVRQSYEVQDLGGFWLPSIDRPASLSSDGGPAMQVDPATGTIVTQADDLDGVVYAVTSELPLRSSTDLALAQVPEGPLATTFTELPTPPTELAQVVRDEIVQKANEVVAGSTRPIDQAYALRDWFLENFDYDPEAPSGHSYGHLRYFILRGNQGSPEHFATAYAVMARAVGLPSRVAVGYLTGTLSDDGSYHVTTEQAHAWPEVWFDGLGWMPLEPTQSRAAVDESSVAEAEAAQQETDEQVAAEGGGAVENEGSGASGAGGDDTSTVERLLQIVLAVAILVVAAFLTCVLVVAIVRGRRRRRRSTGSARERVVGAYQQVLDGLSEAGLRTTRNMTAAELVAWTEGTYGIDAAGELQPLGSLANVALFSGAEPSDAVAEEAWVHADRFGSTLLSGQGVGTRMRHWTDPRLLVRRS